MLALELPKWARRLMCKLLGHIMGPWLFVDVDKSTEFFVKDDHVRQCMRCCKMEYRYNNAASIVARHY